MNPRTTIWWNRATLACAVALLGAASAAVRPLAAQSETRAVRAAMEATLAAWNAGDFAALAAQYAPDARGFFFDGGGLLRGFNRPALETAYAAGFRSTMSARNIEVALHGEVAVAAALLDGSLTLPDGTVREGTWRYTETRVRRDGAWRIVQYHFSEMTTRGGR